MHSSLEQLRAALVAGGCALAGGAPGAVDPEAVRATLVEAGLGPSEDLVAWFTWVAERGVVCEVLPGWAPVGFGDSVALRAGFLDVAERVSGAGAAQAGVYASSAVLLTDPVGTGDVVAVADRGRGAVGFVSQTDWPEGVPVMFDSVAAMVATLVAAWRSGGYGVHEGHVVVQDAAAVEKAWRAGNPGLADTSVPPQVAVVPVTATRGVVPPRGGILDRLRPRRPSQEQSLADAVADQSRRRDERLAAVRELASRSPDVAADVLPTYLSDHEIATVVLEVLAQLRHPDVFPTAVRFLEAGPVWDQRAGVAALRALGGEAAVEALCRAVEHPRPMVAQDAVVALGELGDVRAVPTLRGLLDHPDANLRQRAAEALARIESGAR